MTPRVWNKETGDTPLRSVYVGRGTPWGNPFRIGIDGTREEVISRYAAEVLPTLDLAPLRGRDLVCHCKPLACHADLLLSEASYDGL